MERFLIELCFYQIYYLQICSCMHESSSLCVMFEVDKLVNHCHRNRKISIRETEQCNSLYILLYQQLQKVGK